MEAAARVCFRGVFPPVISCICILSGRSRAAPRCFNGLLANEHRSRLEWSRGREDLSALASAAKPGAPSLKKGEKNARFSAQTACSPQAPESSARPFLSRC